MKRHLAPALFSLSLCAVMGGVHTVGAQTVNTVAPRTVDSANTTVTSPVASVPQVTTTVTPALAGRPTVPAPRPFRLNDTIPGHAAVASDAPSAVMAEWKMPTSRALMIGGAAAAVIGLAAVGGDTGAIIALSGTAVAVYGLFLHYNR